jgi:Fur family ferric uptake transcriptional regulator
MEQEEKVFRNFLTSRGLKFTSERNIILQEAFHRHDHFEAEDLLSSIKKKGKRTSRATIYRTLELLVQCGLLEVVDFGGNSHHYEHILGHQHHDHLVCERCGRIIEFTHGQLEKLKEKVCQEMNFDSRSHTLKIFGICERCRGKANDDNHMEQSELTSFGEEKE